MTAAKVLPLLGRFRLASASLLRSHSFASRSVLQTLDLLAKPTRRTKARCSVVTLPVFLSTRCILVMEPMATPPWVAMSLTTHDYTQRTGNPYPVYTYRCF